ncbi:hypothetical protein J4204_06005 [Candidatus Woesearchaeota archaeon]|nr:hypothetical protein [Candidatus Woesearchaeota archaeon]
MYSSGLEYIVRGNYSHHSYPQVNYFSKNVDDNYSFGSENSIIMERRYAGNPAKPVQYKSEIKYLASYVTSHSFAPEIFLNPSRQKSRFVDDKSGIMRFASQAFELITNEEIPSNISISILPFAEFRALHSNFGSWSSGILGFSVNGDKKQIFVRENHLDALMLVLGHEIGHVLTETLPNKHDEEAKAFAFSIEWAITIKKNNIANLGLNIKDELDFQPARNGLHDVAFAFVDLMVRKGRKAIELHDDLSRRYLSMFDRIY